MWKIDLYEKYADKYIDDFIYVCIYGGWGRM
jgi:hypothetical protein